MPSNPVSLLREAISRRKAVTMIYQSEHAEGPSLRTVRPLRLELAGEHWQLWAFCLHRQQELRFRLDRMQALAIAPGRVRTARLSGRPRGRGSRRFGTVAPQASTAAHGAWLEP
jgi:predicted DNA-binding transcriptional regulator YafY